MFKRKRKSGRKVDSGVWTYFVYDASSDNVAVLFSCVVTMREKILIALKRNKGNLQKGSLA